MGFAPLPFARHCHVLGILCPWGQVVVEGPGPLLRRGQMLGCSAARESLGQAGVSLDEYYLPP